MKQFNVIDNLNSVRLAIAEDVWMKQITIASAKDVRLGMNCGCDQVVVILIIRDCTGRALAGNCYNERRGLKATKKLANLTIAQSMESTHSLIMEYLRLLTKQVGRKE